MRVAHLFFIAGILGCSVFYPLTSAGAGRQSPSQEIYDFTGQELAEERILALFKVANAPYNHNEMKKLVRTVKAQPQPLLLHGVAEYLATVGIHWPLESLAIHYNRSVFQQLSPQARTVVTRYRLKHFRSAYPEIGEYFKQVFNERNLFFSTLLAALKTRDEKSYDTIELLLHVDHAFISDEVLKFLVSSSTHEERIFLLGILHANQLLTEEFQAALPSHTKEDLANILQLEGLKKRCPRNDNGLCLGFFDGKKIVGARIVDPDKGRIGLNPRLLERYTSDLVGLIHEEAGFVLSELLSEKVTAALQSSEEFFPKIENAIRLHDFSLLLPLAVYGVKYFEFAKIIEVIEVSAEARNPFFIQLLLEDDLQEFSRNIFADLSPKASSYVLAVLCTDVAAGKLVRAYVEAAHERQDYSDQREWAELLEEARKALHPFLSDEHRYPYNLADLEVVMTHLKLQIAKKALPIFNAKQISATCNAWDERLRKFGTIPCMRSGI